MRIACVQLRARDVSEAESALREAVEAATDAGRSADLVVLPEATYPGYVLHEAEPYRDPSWFERGRAAFANVAAETEAWVAMGLVRGDGHAVLNSAVLFDPKGQVASIGDKVFMWHFDSGWFQPGRPSEVISLPSGRAGMFVCADARMMEVPRRLAVQGARLLLDPTALVLSPTGTNGQIEYMLAARAWENGVFLAVANKAGVEAGMASYAGRSAIFGPGGERVVEAGPADPEIVQAEVDLSSATGPPVAPATEGYPELSMPLESLPIAMVLASPPPVSPLRVAVLAQADSDQDRVLTELGADVAIGPDLAASPRVFSLQNEKVLCGTEELRSGAIALVGQSRIGVIGQDRGLVPEEVRVLMLRGASVVLWSTGDIEVPEMVARTRADENRVFLLTMAADGAWRVYGPTGTRIASGPQPAMTATLIELPLALTWQKEMAPRTDVVRGRLPSLFGSLASPPDESSPD